MSKPLKLLLSAAIAGQAVPATGDDKGLTLAASSPWNLRYDEDRCRLTRTFGEAEQKVTLMLDQSGVEPYYTVYLVGAPVRPTTVQFMRVRFGEEKPTERSFVTGKLADKTRLVALHGLNLAPIQTLAEGATEEEAEPIGVERENAIQRIAFSKGLGDPITLETGSLGEPLAAMRKCVTDLAGYLGLGDKGNGRIAQSPQPAANAGSWITSIDYPREMLRNDVEGIVRFRLTIDSRGKPTSCHITRSTRPQVFDDVVCLALLKRAKFKPALDNEGKPVAAYWSSAARFEIAN